MLSPWAGRDESALTAGLGPQVPNMHHEVKKLRLKVSLSGWQERISPRGQDRSWSSVSWALGHMVWVHPSLLHPTAGGCCPAAGGGQKKSVAQRLRRGLSVVACAV